MGPCPHLSTAPMSLMGLSVGALIRHADGTDRVQPDEPFHVVQRHPAGWLPVVGLGGTTGAVRPAVPVHRQRVVRLRPLVVPTRAEEVDAIVHQTD